MPGFVVTAWQLQSLLAAAKVEPPGPASPLLAVPTFGRPLSSTEPDFKPLAQQGLVVKEGRKWRVNSVIAGVLRAAAHPDEVISVGVSDPDNPGYQVVRRDQLVAECTVGRVGTTKLYFPLSRSTVVTSLVSALSGDRPEPQPTGFRFVGTAAEAFVLSAALRALHIAAIPVPYGALRADIERDAGNPRLIAALGVTAGFGGIEDLRREPERIDGIVRRLVDEGLLVVTDTGMTPSPLAEAALGSRGLISFGVSRTEVTDGEARTVSLQAIRSGDRLIVARIRRPDGAEPTFEWAETSRVELRSLVAATLLHERELRVLAGEVVPTRPATAPDPTWQPSHLVPAGGMPAWAEPDPNGAIVATLDPGLEVQLVEELGDWGRIVCSNEWSAWVDHTLLDALPRGHTGSGRLPGGWSVGTRGPRSKG